MSVAELSESTAFDSPWGCSISSRLDSCPTTVKVAALKLASYLTEPICKVREYFYSFYILDKTCKTTAHKVMKVLMLTLGIIGCALLMPFTAPVGAAVRGLVATCAAKPYVYLDRGGKGKVLPENKEITLVSHNQCYSPAGFAITDGQVTPSSDKARMDANIQKVKALNPDIICLYEVCDICDADYISSQLPKYPFVIPVAGVRAIGPSSMMYIASKYEIDEDSIEFLPFVKGTELTGRAQYSEKGVLVFSVRSRGETKPFATVISTHLQHSEIPEYPEAEERRSRAAQMKKIATLINTKVAQGSAVIFTGDLNQEEDELEAFLARHPIEGLRRDPAMEGKPTWGGDSWCATLMGKPASGPLVLDYTFIAGKASAISTRAIETGYCGLEFRPEATSDHGLLFSTVTVE